jgi:nicotinamide-nucleotide amidase
MDKTPLEEIVGNSLREMNKTVALAESCTGGLVGHLLTQVPGSSDYLKGGVIAYSYAAKEEILGVKRETLDQFGAVSEETAIEMAKGARELFGADLAIAVTGIAGPSSDSSEKPVGLTWLAVSSDETTQTETHQWEGNRSENKQQSAEAALILLLSSLRDIA